MDIMPLDATTSEVEATLISFNTGPKIKAIFVEYKIILWL
jgi:hypothetical protein